MGNLAQKISKRLLPPDYYEPVKISWASLPGAISAKELTEHWKLYTGYIEALKRIDNRVPIASKPTMSVVDSEYRSLKEAESYVIGGALLHGLYFEQFSQKPETVTGLLQKQLASIWEKGEDWWADMRAAAMNARGWAVLGVCEIDPNDIRIFVLDSHSTGTMFGYSPLLVLDAYEHAYWGDFGTNKGAHFDNLIKYLDWPKLEERYQQVMPR